MFLIRCIPIVGTAVTAVEAVGALLDGDGKKFVSKLAQTAVGGVMDAAFIMSGGASSLVRKETLSLRLTSISSIELWENLCNSFR